LLTALGAAVLTGAGQLGVAYGLGIVRFARTFGPGTENQWNAQLAWVGWFAMVAAIAGAVTAAGVARRHDYQPGAGTRIALALLGGLGAGTVAPLSMLPARAAQLTTQSFNPAFVVGLAAGLGAVAGLLAAIAILGLRTFTWSVATIGTLIWIAGLVSAAPHLGPKDSMPTIRLGVLDNATQAGSRWVETLGMPVAALLAGAAVAGVARWRQYPPLAAAISGLVGPATLALAYLIAGPGLNSNQTDQVAPYLGALIAVPAGLLGSLLVVVARRPTRAAKPATEAGSAEQPDLPGQTPTRTGAARNKKDKTDPQPVPLEPSNILPPVVPTRATGRATARSANRDDAYVGWVNGLVDENDREPLPRRTPKQRSSANNPARPGSLADVE
jgi:type IV secretory pathway TrbD component